MLNQWLVESANKRTNHSTGAQYLCTLELTVVMGKFEQARFTPERELLRKIEQGETVSDDNLELLDTRLNGGNREF